MDIEAVKIIMQMHSVVNDICPSFLENEDKRDGECI